MGLPTLPGQPPGKGQCTGGPLGHCSWVKPEQLPHLPTIQWGQLPPGGGEATGPRQGGGAPVPCGSWRGFPSSLCWCLVPSQGHYVLGELIMLLGKHYDTFMAALKLICH